MFAAGLGLATLDPPRGLVFPVDPPRGGVCPLGPPREAANFGGRIVDQRPICFGS